jgi:16S rRNA (guanine966-N2)-methyltransferase
MRIVAGRFGGRRIDAPRGTRTRPTSDRVREALFSVLGDIAGLTVLDLFAGSGALGLEALSRGASRATFVERDPAALRALDANIAALGVDADVRRGDARAFVRNASAAAEPYDLIFVDPPYSDAQALGSELDLGPLLTANGRIVVESHRSVPLEIDLPTTFERRYGDTVIRIHGH